MVTTKIYYEKGTSDLIFETGRVESTTSELLNKSKILFSKYNNATNYDKVVDWTGITVGEYPAFYIEFEDKQSPVATFGKTVVIWGEEFDGRKKYYGITLLAKQLTFENEKTLFNESFMSFSLEQPLECPPDQVDDTTDDTQDTSGDDTTDDTTDQTDGTGTDDEVDSEDTTDTSNTGQNPNTNPPQSGEFKLFGFDGVLVIGGIILLLLVLFFVIIVIAVIAVLAYFAFFKNRR